MSPRQWLRAELRSHNRRAAALALLSLACAVLAWNLAYFFFMLAVLGFYAAIHGGSGTELPAWAPLSALALVVVLFAWGGVDRLRHRYAGVPDRPIIGFHLVGDILLLPVRLTWAIWGNCSAIRRLNASEVERAWELLATIRHSGKGYLRNLALVEPDTDALFRLVTTLQMLGLIDLHRGEGDWFYTVRSTQMEQVGRLLEP